MAGHGDCITLVNDSTMHLPLWSKFCPTEVLCWVGDEGVAQEKKNEKYLFTRKENKNPGDKRQNRTAGNGLWRSVGSDLHEKAVLPRSSSLLHLAMQGKS
uniref:Uncharacterized protein n=1 Tax=Leersia perrieri TaxID=77586 RepID=A0A0D9XSD7_9ORYZ